MTTAPRVGVSLARVRFVDSLAAASAAHREFERLDLCAGVARNISEAGDFAGSVFAIDLFIEKIVAANAALRRELNQREDLLGTARIWAEEANVEAMLAAQEAPS